jgi:hypothetical protein
MVNVASFQARVWGFAVYDSCGSPVARNYAWSLVGIEEIILNISSCG